MRALMLVAAVDVQHNRLEFEAVAYAPNRESWSVRYEVIGNILRVIAGAGRGQLRKITGNTATQLSWDLPLLLDTNSVWIVEAPAWDYTGDSTAFDNADSLRAVTMNIPTDNFIDQAVVIAGFTVDVNGNESPDGDVAIREDWIYGAEGLARVAGFTLPVSGTLGIQADAAPAFYLDSDFTAGSVKAYVKSAPVGTRPRVHDLRWRDRLAVAHDSRRQHLGRGDSDADRRGGHDSGEYERSTGDYGGGHYISGRGPFGVHILVKAAYALLAAAG